MCWYDMYLGTTFAKTHSLLMWIHNIIENLPSLPSFFPPTGFLFFGWRHRDKLFSLIFLLAILDSQNCRTFQSRTAQGNYPGWGPHPATEIVILGEPPMPLSNQDVSTALPGLGLAQGQLGPHLRQDYLAVRTPYPLFKQYVKSDIFCLFPLWF